MQLSISTSSPDPLPANFAAALLGAPSATGSIADFSALFPNLAPGQGGPSTAPATGNPAAYPPSSTPVAGRPIVVSAAAAPANPLSAPSRRSLGTGAGQAVALGVPAQTAIAGELSDFSEPAKNGDLPLDKPDARGGVGPSRRLPAGRGAAASAPPASVEPAAALPLPLIAPELPPAPVVFAAAGSEFLAANVEAGLGGEIPASCAREAPELGRSEVTSAFVSNQRFELTAKPFGGLVTAKPVNSERADADLEAGEGRAAVTPESVDRRRERGPLYPIADDSDGTPGLDPAPVGRTTAGWQRLPVAAESAPSHPPSWGETQFDPGAVLAGFSRAKIAVRPATPIAPALIEDAPFLATGSDRLPEQCTNGDRASRPIPTGDGQDSRGEFVPGVASRWTAAAIDSSRGENSAARAENRFARSGRRAEATFKSFEAPAAKEVAVTVESVGTGAADFNPSMLESPLNLRTDTTLATSATIGISAAETAGTDSQSTSDPAPMMEAVTTVSRAVEAVLTAAEHAAHGDRNSVNLRFSVGEADLSVRVELRDNEVHATFLTESADLRTALAQEWRSAAVEVADRPIRFSAPALSGGNGGSLSFNSGAGDTPAGHDHGQPSPSSPGSATRTVFTGRSRVPASEAPDRINPAPRALPTSVHLHTLA